jgi:hypothetical protein
VAVPPIIDTMEASNVKSWIDVVQGLITIAASIVGGFWAWSRFIVERGLLPPSQMDIAVQTVGSSDTAYIVEVEVRIKNKGSSALVVTDFRLRLRYLEGNDSVEIIQEPEHPAYGRLAFPHLHPLRGAALGEPGSAEIRMQTKGHGEALRPGEVRVVPYDTFVQPDVEQVYTFVTALPRQSTYVLVRASFRYEMHPSKMQLRVLRISRRLGMIQYSLDHVNKPHTVERTFPLRQAV